MKDKGVKCGACQFKFKGGVRCVIDPAKCGSYKSKSPDKVLGDTVVKKEINCEACRADCVVPIGKRINQPVPLWCSAYQSEFDKALEDIIKVLKAWYPYCQTLQGQLEFDRLIKDLEESCKKKI